jgi:hypothetical protein
MDRSNFAVYAVNQPIPENQAQGAFVGVSYAALTVGAAVVVAALGGGIWYLLWKISLHFVLGH